MMISPLDLDYRNLDNQKREFKADSQTLYKPRIKYLDSWFHK